MDRLQGIETHFRVAQTGCYAEAARPIGVDKSEVSTHMAALEKPFGAPLSGRITRGVGLSDSGSTFADKSVRLLGRAADLVEHVHECTADPRGLLKVQALPGFVIGHMRGWASIKPSFSGRAHRRFPLFPAQGTEKVTPLRRGLYRTL